MAQRLSSFLSISSLASTVVLAACGAPAPISAVDGGSDAAVHPDAYLAPDSCDMDRLHRLDGVAGGSVGIDFDTTMTSTRPRDLGDACGNTAADIRWAPQEVVEFHVPGTGMQGVQFSTSNAMTTANFNTLVQVRQGSCRAVPTATFPPSCFDDVSQTNLESTGGITVMGGTTLYFIVTGYSHPPAGEMSVDRGNVHIDFTVAPNTAPMLTAGSAVFSRGDTIIAATATDAEGPIAGYSMAFYHAAGQIDINGDGVANGDDVLTLGFDTVARAAPMYTGHSHINGMTTYALATYCHQAAVHCTEIGLRVFDAQYAISNELRVPALDAAIVGVGAVCDDLHLCADGLVCASGMCTVIPSATTECAAAMPFVIPTPTTAATMARNNGTIGTGTGVFSASCAPTAGKEQIWQITIPAGHFDLALTTDTTGTATGVDTVISLRSTCVDQTTELAMGCNDDISGTNFRSHLTFRDIPAGDYFALVELYGGAAASPYALQATLTPVLASGTACDPAMTNYRCATGTCSATTMMCP